MLGAVKNRSVSSLLHSQFKSGFHRGLSSLNKMDLITSLITDNNATAACATAGDERKDILSLQEVEKILSDVRAEDVKVIPVQNQSFTDHVVLATGRSAWHVRNIAQALCYKAKLKQRGCEKKLLPSVEGQKGGKWIVVDSGSLVIHALDEKMRAYYNLDALWTEEKLTQLTSEERQDEAVENGLVKVRRKNNSKKRPVKSA
ncbi:protein Iojap-related, mitochondrial [Heracleum sosnowskyi]|uniref:Protein Iojap-related, mitochondrial n=1 Tax=Heracleum sosnowskyi TaxID=360622 RepID=A0AAD8I3R0_9APIA|nr:protein Iojap-related, mitochondrial [Heracleum sosnowskyi]